MEKYFEKGTLDEDEMREGLKLGMIHHDVFPCIRDVGEEKYGKRTDDGIYRQCCTSPLEAKPEIRPMEKKSRLIQKATRTFVFKSHLSLTWESSLSLK